MSEFMNPQNIQGFSMGDSWPNPNMTIVNAGVREAPALPVECFSYGSETDGIHTGAAACIVEEARRRSCPADYVAGGLLAVAASLIGNSRRAWPWGSWREPIALNVGLVGKPSAKKSPAMDIVLAPLKEFERQLEIDHRHTLRGYEREVLEAKIAQDAWRETIEQAAENNTPGPDMPEKAEAPLKPGCPFITASDATVPAMADVCAASKKGVLLKRDELAGWLLDLGKYGGDGDRSFYIEAYGGRSFSIDRKKNDRRIEIDRLLISILGGIQPDKLATALLAGDDDGLPARFLYFWPDPVPFVAPGDDDYDTGLASALGRLNNLTMRELADNQSEPVTLPLTQAARSLFERWCDEITRRGNNADGLMAGFIGKAMGGVLRVAVILEHIDWAFGDELKIAPESISAQTVKRAILLYDDYFIPMAERAFGDAARPMDERLAGILAKAILKRREDIIYCREIQRHWKLPGLSRANPINTAARVLIEMDWLESISERVGPTSGRTATMWRVNPKVWGAL